MKKGIVLFLSMILFGIFAAKTDAGNPVRKQGNLPDAYIIELPSSLDGLYTFTQEFVWGNEGYTLNATETRFYHVVSVPGLNLQNMGQVALIGPSWRGFGLTNTLADKIVILPDQGKVYIDLGIQECSELVEFDCSNNTSCVPIVKPMVCWPPEANSLLGKMVYLTVPR